MNKKLTSVGFCCVPVSKQYTVHALFHLLLTIALGGVYYHVHFTSKDTEDL
jgi:hypothetical protein